MSVQKSAPLTDEERIENRTILAIMGPETAISLALMLVTFCAALVASQAGLPKDFMPLRWLLWGMTVIQFIKIGYAAKLMDELSWSLRR